VTCHSPGPWTFGPSYSTGADGKAVEGPHLAILDGDEGLIVATVWARFVSRSQAGANARLMAAAPDLYRELSHLVRLLEPLESGGLLSVPGLATLNGARAALARAEGV
jgi:hypothetical protein